jgi:carboxypeptidase D
MVGFDVPHVSHDMILRFMGVDFSAFTNGTARIPSAIGENRKPSVVFAQPDASATAPSAGKTKTPEMDKAMWEAYYNAGSAALVLLLVLVAIAVFFWCRRRRARSARAGITLPRGGGADDEEESIPLSRSVQDGHDTPERAPSRMNGSSSGNGNAYHDAADTRVGMTKEGKGKGRAQEAIFDVGSDDEK